MFFRCPTRFRHRPSQADLLQVDVNWRGQPIAHDAGTYSYNATGAFRGALKEAAVHNTITFDGAEPLEKVGRFLYLPWPTGRAGWVERGKKFGASHDGWKKRGIAHKRTLSVESAAIAVEDDIQAQGSHIARLHWLLADGAYTVAPDRRSVTLATPRGPVRVAWQSPEADISIVRADPHSNRGWWSPYYLHAAPALSLAIEFRFSGKATVRTEFRAVAEQMTVNR